MRLSFRTILCYDSRRSHRVRRRRRRKADAIYYRFKRVRTERAPTRCIAYPPYHRRPSFARRLVRRRLSLRAIESAAIARHFSGFGRFVAAPRTIIRGLSVPVTLLLYASLTGDPDTSSPCDRRSHLSRRSARFPHFARYICAVGNDGNNNTKTSLTPFPNHIYIYI